MSNKTKQEPVNTGSPTPKPKKRGRKPSKKQYFTSDVDAAIKEYLSTSNQKERDTIYSNRIHYAFLDAQHEFENVIQEYNFVKQRQFTNDIIVFDDVTKNKFDGVCKAVEKGMTLVPWYISPFSQI